MAIRVLQSFPHRIGAGRICTTAWHQAAGADSAGATLTVYPTSVHRTLPPTISVEPTLAWGTRRVPYRVFGERTFAVHDRIVAHRLPKLASELDVVHAWPLAAQETLKVARRLGIPTVLERPNAHTRFAYDTVAQESARLGVTLPADHEHSYNVARLEKEEREYLLTDWLLCPSDFVAQTFRSQGFADSSLLRHTYGYDETVYFADPHKAPSQAGLNALFVGVCAVRKGLHFALEAWLRSSASRHGRFRIAGEFVPEYFARLEGMLSHPSVEVLGHSEHVPKLMRDSDVLMLPSIEEGFGLVVVEAMASGCVPLVSEACTDVATHDHTGLRHAIGDVDALSIQLTMLDEDRDRLATARAACLDEAPEHTWSKAGERLVEVYRAAAGYQARPDCGLAGVDGRPGIASA